MTLGDLLVFERKRWSNRYWGKRLLQVAAMVLAVVASVIFARLGYLKQPSVIWLALLGILYAAPGIGAGVMAREWKEDTWYWWLSLPASREKLLAAKLLNAIGRWIRIWLTLFVFVSIYIAIIDVTLGQLSWSLFLSQIKFGWEVGILAIIEGPLLIIMGLWMGALRRSDKNKFLLAPMWAIILVIINTQFNGLRVVGVGAQIKPELILNYHWFSIKFVAVYILTAVVFFGLARWLKLPK